MTGMENRDYSDIIDLPHHVSSRHPHMSRVDRAAQFGSFEPIRDYKDALKEERRLTEERPELSEEDQNALSDAVRKLAKETSGQGEEGTIRHPQVTLTYFLPDEKKSGGTIDQTAGRVRAVNEELRYLVFEDGRRFAFRDMLKVQFDDARVKRS